MLTTVVFKTAASVLAASFGAVFADVKRPSAFTRVVRLILEGSTRHRQIMAGIVDEPARFVTGVAYREIEQPGTFVAAGLRVAGYLMQTGAGGGPWLL